MPAPTLFVVVVTSLQDMQSNVVEPPKTPNLRLSASTSLSYIVFEERPTATCLMHTHSINSVLATLIDPTESSKTFKITHQEMLKGIGHHAYDDILEIPIIDNRPSEDLLGPQLREAIRAYPKANAVLVRRHGVYVWGDSWEQAKTQLESFDYLFGVAVEMKKLGLDPAVPPSSGTFRVDNEDDKRPFKRVRKTEGFNGMAASENQADLEGNVVPILPRDAKILLLDIEGTTSSIA
jgi:methylthioribulose-1-phosphate dehydratase